MLNIITNDVQGLAGECQKQHKTRTLEKHNTTKTLGRRTVNIKKEISNHDFPRENFSPPHKSFWKSRASGTTVKTTSTWRYPVEAAVLETVQYPQQARNIKHAMKICRLMSGDHATASNAKRVLKVSHGQAIRRSCRYCQLGRERLYRAADGSSGPAHLLVVRE
jgi:hypothetical protein